MVLHFIWWLSITSLMVNFSFKLKIFYSYPTSTTDHCSSAHILCSNQRAGWLSMIISYTQYFNEYQTRVLHHPRNLTSLESKPRSPEWKSRNQLSLSATVRAKVTCTIEAMYYLCPTLLSFVVCHTSYRCRQPEAQYFFFFILTVWLIIKVLSL